jgi:hypothetical protein
LGICSRLTPAWRFPAQLMRSLSERVLDEWLNREAPLVRAEYRKVAVQYSDFAAACLSPFLRGFYRRIAEDYLSRAEVALRAAESEAAHSSRARD